MLEVKADKFTWEKREGGLHHGVAEASQLGLAPGEWPPFLIVHGKKETRIFHNTTLPHPVAWAKACNEGHVYDDNKGVSIRILND